MKALLVAALLTVGGCASAPQRVWQKEGGTQDQFAHDRLACAQYGQQSAMANGLAGNMFVGIWVAREAEACMTTLGYR